MRKNSSFDKSTSFRFQDREDTSVIEKDIIHILPPPKIGRQGEIFLTAIFQTIILANSLYFFHLTLNKKKQLNIINKLSLIFLFCISLFNLSTQMCTWCDAKLCITVDLTILTFFYPILKFYRAKWSFGIGFSGLTLWINSQQSQLKARYVKQFFHHTATQF